MQKGFQGSKALMIDKSARQYADRLDCVTTGTLTRLLDNINAYEKDGDVYHADLNRCRLNYVIERAAKEGVK